MISLTYKIKWLYRCIYFLWAVIIAMGCIAWYQQEHVEILLDKLKTATVIPVKTWEEVSRDL